MTRTLLAGIAFMAASLVSATDARGVDLHGDVLVALLATDTPALAQQQSRRGGTEPAPATYADRAMRLGGGGGTNEADANSDTRATAPDPADPIDQEPESKTTTPTPHISAWRALLPGSIQ